ncbi:MAG: cysteine desulfurase [Kosmotogales bacterium]|nr:cysteine desulfurase [Kosmotogales bacterium]
MKTIYFDHAATTPVRKEVIDKMYPFFNEFYGNPSSIYDIATISKSAIEDSRKIIASVFNADAGEIFFTSGGTESDNWAIIGTALANEKKGKHIITSSVEHHAVLHTFEYLSRHGFEVTYLPVDENGKVKIDELKKAIRKDTILVSVMYANNEIGTIQPIEEISNICKDRKIIFHSDAVQAVGQIRIDLKKTGIDLLSMSAHKFNGPKGVGALFIRKGTKIDNFLHGGAQENKRRAGTENVPGIVGMAEAISLAYENMEEKNKKIIKLRDKIIDGIKNNIPHVKFNGDPVDRLPNNVNFSFRYIEGESLLLMLNMKGIAASSGSACTSGSLDPSHVLLSIGLSHEVAHGSLRITLGYENKEEEVDYLLQILPGIVQRLRDMSPLYDEFLKGEGDKNVQ